MYRCVCSALVLLVLLAGGHAYGARPVFELPSAEDTFECSDMFLNRVGAAWLAYGYQCFKKSETLNESEARAKHLVNALNSFQEAQKETINPLISSVSTFFEGLTYCKLINHVVCDSANCEEIVVNNDDDVEKTRICAYRKKMYNAFYNVDFEDMLIEDSDDSNEVEGIIKAYEKCVNEVLTEDMDNLCYRGKTVTTDPEELKKYIQDEIKNEVVPLFKDVSSPYYALFNKKIEIADFFTASAKERIDSLFEEKSRLTGVLSQSENKYRQYFALIDPIYKDYLDLNINITKDYNRLMDLKASLLEENMVMELKEKALEMADVEQKIQTEATELQSIDKQEKIDAISAQGIELCKIYYCHLRTLPTLRFKRLCQSNDSRNDPLCKKEIYYKEYDEDKNIQIIDLCTQIAPDLSRFWNDNLDRVTDNELINECLHSF